MALPVVAIVGRPNVGKSSLLNCLARHRIAIVEPTAGVTRDRVSTLVEANGRWMELVDTGGMEFETTAELAADVTRQIDTALAEASLVLFVVDVQAGRLPLDEEVATRLRAVECPIIVAANKADNDKLATAGVAEFFALGYDPVLPVSAKHGRGRHELMDAVTAALAEAADERPADVAMRVAVVGKRNAGKSTFINALAGSERVIVSEIPGTTRDAIDIRFEKDGLTYMAIDTAGVRKKKSLQDDIEFYSLTRAMSSIRRADVVLLLIDATTPLSRVDKKLAAEVEGGHTPVVFVVNKWDLAKGQATTGEYADYLTASLPGLAYAPVAFTTAKDGRNVQRTVDLARSLFKQARTRVPTAELNEVVEATLRRKRPPSPRTRLPRVYFATQVAVQPPTIVLSVNDPDLFSQSYRRYVVNRFRDELPFPEVPIRVVYRAHREKAKKAGKPRGRGQRRRRGRG